MKDDEKGYQYDRAEMLMRQRDMAEEERDAWKIRAMRAMQERHALAATSTSLRDLLTIAEGQRDQAKIDAEHWKAEWAVVVGQLGGARAEVQSLRKFEARWYEHITLQAAIDAALAVQPTTGETNE